MDKNKVSEASFLVLAKVPSHPHGPASFHIPLGLLAPPLSDLPFFPFTETSSALTH